jgi:hypothetical protein
MNITSMKIINLYHLPQLEQDLQNRTIFVGMTQFTSSKNPIATSGILPCLGIGISGGGINYFEHASPHDYKIGGASCSRMLKVIEKFRDNKQIPTVYLFRNILDSEINYIIDNLSRIGLLQNVIFCNLSELNMLNSNTYVGIYNNRPFWFNSIIKNKSFNRSKNYLNFNFTNTNIEKAKKFSVGEYVMLQNIPEHKYVIIDIKKDGSMISLYNITKPYYIDSFAHVGPDRLIKTEINNKTRSYSNVVKGKKKIYPIPEHIQTIINKRQ